MHIKKFTANTLKDALESMKQEMGGEAVVLSTKVYDADLKTGREKTYEITAGLENVVPLNKTAPTKTEKETANDYQKELENLSKKISQKNNKTVSAEKNKKADTINTEQLRTEYEEITDVLLQREIDRPNVHKIMEQLNKYSSFLTKENIDQYVVSTIGALIPTASFEINKNSKPTLIGLVGPTGVGKTTCIAKLAVISKILHNLDIGLISIDTYRLGAIDQLKIFSEISNIDFLVAYDPKDLHQMVEKFKKKDIIFIDTAGRSQNNQALLEDIKKFLSVIKLDETYLVLNSTSTTRNLIDQAKKFRLFNYNGFIFTKLDEAVSYGNIFNVVNTFNIPIKYLTNGQVIPDDILAADPEFIANLIYTGKISQ